ncbi:septum site-determining protein MinC [Acuticoccus sp. MNP-M23]|uniref:septum site-determining protein MinC n=1 Tax=Acuticoccus sp. MNP-M23 TaxID=3072793 RepID=UPI002816282A|nr:septum site-determining protein MinC [Acuticoccus sp. MNP-M23]WMS44227.1 septum site-determining protein MinC [Acuticoccus sp. MNP-M23]
MAFVLTPMPPISDWLEEFDSFAKRSPGFFAGRPVVVDISHMPATRPDLVHMVTELKRRHITIMGLDGRTPGELGADARGLPPILTGGKEVAALAELGAKADAFATPAEEAPVAAPAEEQPLTADAKRELAEAALAAVEEAMEQPDNETLILDEPVRSGMSVVHLKGDVVVIGSVASGSEIVAAGSIHIYGALRGRAIAGSNGDRKARIFCNALHAELVAINGLYKTNEDLDPACVGRSVQAWLDGDALKMAAFNGKGS